MSKTFEQSKEEVAKLCKYFSINQDAFRAPGVKEAHIRQSLIDPFFEALGWDVSNRSMIAPQYREVIPEDRLEVEGQQKAPDYTFRVGSLAKFYVEAKKCGVNINNDPAPAFQLRRYGWSAKLPLSILTDFEELAVYDCTALPSPSQKASHARIQFFKYEEFPDRWHDLWEVFSREAVWSGAFDQYAASKRKRGTSEVDVEFLKTIEGWRIALARNMALRNSDLSSDDLNAAVQVTIDRVVFLRMAEDRGIEPHDQLLRLCERPNIYPRFIRELCRKADQKYNSGLFHFQREDGVSETPDRLTPRLTVDDRVFKSILESLYFSHGSPYDFRVLPVEILGTVYERFLGKVIRLTAGHQAKIEDKPEVRKAGGVYYTPAYVVEYIVKQTVGRLIAGRSPSQLAGTKNKPPFRVLDMACGSGSFLLGAYQCLLDHCSKWYLDNSPETFKKAFYKDSHNGQWRLTIEEKKRILTAHIFGVDIDQQAVEVSKLSLLLKVLEGESAESVGRQMQLFQERALPNLSDNIKCGNSLIGPDYFKQRLGADADEIKKVNAFDWKDRFPGVAGGFDCVIGNPPYDVMEKERGAASWPHAALVDYTHDSDGYDPALGGKLNLFRFFLIRGIQRLASHGRFGMIVPLSLLADISTAATRKFMFTSLEDAVADCFPQKDNPARRIFRDAKLSTLVLTGSPVTKPMKADSPFTVRTYPWNSFRDTPRVCTLRLSELTILGEKTCPVPLVDEATWSVCKRVHDHPKVVPLGTVANLIVTRGEINQTIYREYITDDSRHVRLLKGVEIGPYRQNAKLSQGSREWLDEQRFLRHESPRPQTQVSRIATQRITGVDERRRIVATLIEAPCYFADSTNSIQVADGDPEELLYLLALLNSKLFQWRFKLTSTNNNVGTNELDAMPYRTIEGRADSSKRDDLVSLVNGRLSLHKQTTKSQAQAIAMLRQMASNDAEINHLVYGLYDLSPDEIRIIEGDSSTIVDESD